MNYRYYYIGLGSFVLFILFIIYLSIFQHKISSENFDSSELNRNKSILDKNTKNKLGNTLSINIHEKNRPFHELNGSRKEIPDKSISQFESDKVKISDVERDQIINIVRDAAITYDPSSLSIIVPYLNSKDSEIRSEAINAVVTIGDPSGAPFLRAQAYKEADETLKQELLSLANWLELPPASLVLPKKSD